MLRQKILNFASNWSAFLANLLEYSIFDQFTFKFRRQRLEDKPDMIHNQTKFSHLEDIVIDKDKPERV